MDIIIKIINQYKKEFLQLNTRIKQLNDPNYYEQIEEINNIISSMEQGIEKIKKENNEEINKITKELDDITQQINNLTNNEEKTKIRLNDDILNYRKIISDKFDLIKKQLQKYKSKYGSNLGIYNRLIDGINDTIKQTYNKYPDEDNNLDDYGYNYKNNKSI